VPDNHSNQWLSQLRDGVNYYLHNIEESLSSSSSNSSRGLLLGHQPGPFIGVEVSSECGKREVVPKSALTGDTCVCMATNNRNKSYYKLENNNLAVSYLGNGVTLQSKPWLPITNARSHLQI
jgi:hypothetical protein